MNHDPTDRITLHKYPHRVRIRVGKTAIADTRDALELRENGYLPRQYLPREEVAMEYLQRSSTRTHCPFKGDATYYSVIVGDKTIEDAAWSYESPLEAMREIAARLAFDSHRVEELIEESTDDPGV